ncbi:MAG: glucose/mannose transport system permease protein, partial [Thermosipho sp. (in: thermotogales)]|nr:glucose/mannose transport system permease protein [Thermosipho sp. (in: thermotogales)]
MKKFFSYFFLIIIAIYIITPLYVLLATSFKPLSEIGISDMWKLPKSW